MKETPIRLQYLRVKQQFPQAIVFFRLGDFYETFDEDARIASKELEIVLTSREMGKDGKIPMAGIPFHAVDNYLAKLINRGYKVAICEQMTKPGETKGIIQRDVVRVVTPGTVIEPGLLDSKSNNYLASVIFNNQEAGIAYVDITTGEFAATQLDLRRLGAELERLKPSEIIVPDDADLTGLNIIAPVSKLEKYHFDPDVSRRELTQHFDVATLDGFGCGSLPLAVRAAGAIIHYLQETQKDTLSQLTQLATYSTKAYMELDEQTRRNLEIFRGRTSVTGSLLSIVDITKTPMGGRLLKKWIGQPLLEIQAIQERQKDIGWFVDSTLPRSRTISRLSGIADLERLVGRIKANAVLPRELISLRSSLKVVPELKNDIAPEKLNSGLKPFPEVVALIDQSIIDEPAYLVGEGGVIKTNFSEELDKLRGISGNARQFLVEMENREREKTGIKTLKVGYNRVFGYYIEVSQSYARAGPADIHSQANARWRRAVYHAGA